MCSRRYFRRHSAVLCEQTTLKDTSTTSKIRNVQIYRFSRIKTKEKKMGEIWTNLFQHMVLRDDFVPSIYFASVLFVFSPFSNVSRIPCAWEYPLIRQTEEWRQHDLLLFFCSSWNPIPPTKIFGNIQRPRRTQQISSTRLVSVTQALEMRRKKRKSHINFGCAMRISDELIVCCMLARPRVRTLEIV